MALPLRAALRSAGRFMVQHPTTMLSMARHALGLRVAVPLDALRWFIANTPPSKKAPQDVTITPRPPAIGLSATIDLMGTTVRAGASIRVDQIEVSDTQFKVTLRLSDVTMKVLGEAHDDIIVIDLMQNPKFASNERARGILGTLTPVVNVSGLSTEGDFLIVQLR